MVPDEHSAKRYIFISYSRANNEFVHRLSSDLQQRNLATWIDKQGLKAGTRNWERAIREAIEGCYAVLLVASPNSFDSEYVQGEIAIANGYNRPIYPVWATGEHWIDCVPMDMSKVQFIDARTDSKYTIAIDQIVQALSGLGIPSLPTIRDTQSVKTVLPPDFVPQNPYKGLQAFTGADTHRFFGRDSFTAELIATLKQKLDNNAPRFLALIGASGSGKSSIMMAGLLPRLRQGAVQGSGDWVYIDRILPGARPLSGLTEALYQALPSKSYKAIEEDLRHPSGIGLHRIAHSMVKSGGRVVLYIDQFEELYTQTTDKEEREQFINLLTTAATEPEGVVLVLLTLRADFYDRPLEDEQLGKLMETGSKPILPLTLSELYEAIEKPAALPESQLTFDAGLATDLVFAVRDEIGGLPLLQFTLDLLYERRDGTRLTRTAYDAIGGLRGALTKHAEATYMDLPSAEHRRLARALFLRLIEPGMTEQDTTRRRAALRELTLSDPEQSKIMYATADAFVKARLLLTNRTLDEETIEVSHEALIREWDLLRQWLNEARKDLRFQKRMRLDVAEWVAQGKRMDDTLLYRDEILQNALSWMQTNVPSEDEAAFIRASSNAIKRMRVTSRRQRIGLGLTFTIIVITFVLAGLRLLSTESERNVANSTQTAIVEVVLQLSAIVTPTPTETLTVTPSPIRTATIPPTLLVANQVGYQNFLNSPNNVLLEQKLYTSPEINVMLIEGQKTSNSPSVVPSNFYLQQNTLIQIDAVSRVDKSINTQLFPEGDIYANTGDFSEGLVSIIPQQDQGLQFQAHTLCIAAKQIPANLTLPNDPDKLAITCFTGNQNDCHYQFPGQEPTFMPIGKRILLDITHNKLIEIGPIIFDEVKTYYDTVMALTNSDEQVSCLTTALDQDRDNISYPNDQCPLEFGTTENKGCPLPTPTILPDA